MATFDKLLKRNEMKLFFNLFALLVVVALCIALGINLLDEHIIFSVQLFIGTFFGALLYLGYLTDKIDEQKKNETKYPY